MWAVSGEAGITCHSSACSRSIVNALPVFLNDMAHRRTLWTLYSTNFLNAIGMWFFLPLLPIFLGRKGSSAALVGAVFAAGLLASALVRYPAGWLADRIGTRAVMLGAMLATAVLFLAYLLPLPAAAYVGVRFLQGAAQGGYWPAANGLLADVTPREERGRAFGYMQSTNMAGMLIGPGIGGFIALFNLGIVFGVSAALALLTMAALGTLPNVHARSAAEVPSHPIRIARLLAPLILMSAGTAYMIGTFDTIWPLYLTYRGGSTLAVGLSFVAFALPAMLLSGYAGSLADRLGPRRLIVSATLCSAFFSALYPFVASVPWLIGLGLLEGAVSIAGLPAVMAEVSRLSGAGQLSRTQGVYQSVQTVVQIAGALLGGALFTLSPTFAFLAIVAVCLLSAGTAFVPRTGLARRVSETR